MSVTDDSDEVTSEGNKAATEPLALPEAPSVTIHASLQPSINLALWHNHVPALTELSIENRGTETLRDVTVDLKSDPPVIRPHTWRLQHLMPGQIRPISDLDLPLDGPLLASLTEATRCEVVFSVQADGQERGALRHDIRLLAPSEWGGSVQIPDILAAFVEPNDPAVARILRTASDMLRAAGKVDSLEGYQRGNKQRAYEQAEAIWSAVCSLDIRYVNPPASFEQVGQRIRPPRQILGERLGTCLDTTVLLAACLEQAGLRPVIVLLQGHAFAGVWLAQQDFGGSVVDDAPGLRNRIALDDLRLFETTLLTQSPKPGFRRACDAGAAHVALGKDDNFVALIDVHRARQRRIRPLPGQPAPIALLDTGAEETAPDGPPPLEDAPALREETLLEEAPAATPADRLARWRQRLLDLSGRNRLLNMKLGGKQALVIDCPDPARLEDMLAQVRERGRAAPFRLRPWPDLMGDSRDPRSAALHRRRLQEDAPRAFALQALEKRELLADRDESTLQVTLTEIYRAAKAAQEEGGSNTLFLTFGALLWKPKARETPYRAPLILVPVVLDRPSIRSGFTLSAHDDEPRLNTTLLEMLRQEFDIHFPGLEDALPSDGSGLDVHAILDRIRAKLRNIPGWEVTDEVALTNLSFTKYLMWKDLADRAEALRANEVARRLMDGVTRSAGEQEEQGGSGVAHPMDQMESSTAVPVCPLEADSSQLRAVSHAAEGRSFVLIGPPGTGKSQTIANIIANTLSQGRTVLFVAEKRAALEVVERRLRQVGLGEFCLDLFSAKSGKMEVLQQLNRATQVADALADSSWEEAQAELSGLQAELNGYVADLHRRGRNGWTAFRAMGCLLRAEGAGVPEIALAWPSADAHDAAAWQRLLQTVEDAAATMLQLGDLKAATALLGVERAEWSPPWQSRLLEAARRAASRLDAVLDAHAAALRALAINPSQPPTRRDLQTLDALAAVLLEPQAQSAGWTTSEGAQAVHEAVLAAEQLTKRHQDLTASLQGRWRPEAMALPLQEIRREWTEASERWALPRMMAQKAVRKRLGAAAEGAVPEDCGGELDRLINLQEVEASIAGLAVDAVPLGRRWQGRGTDFGRLQADYAWAQRLRAATGSVAHEPAGLLVLRDHLRRLLQDGADLLQPEGAIGLPLRHFREAWSEAQAALKALGEESGSDISTVAAAEADWLAALAGHLRGWEQAARHLRDWCAWRGVAQRAADLGLGPLLDAMENGLVSPADTVRVFEANYARWWLGLVVEDTPRLRAFVAAQHEKRIERFRALDTQVLSLATRLIRGRLAQGIPGAAQRQHDPEYVVLTRELAKKQRHMPVRQLASKMPKALRRLTPCLMMSPLSIAQYLPADAEPFDLVIFDEASQIPTWDAIGAIGRGRQVIVVGDPKQLPPTSFFSRQIAADDEEVEGPDGTLTITQDLESILDECLGAGIPATELTWHYRSRHESLIAFSNHTYYGGRLVTFPSPVTRDAAVSLRHVADGAYARAGARHNQPEARAVVAEAVARLRATQTEGGRGSIGIVTFNAEQQKLIENLLDEARRADPSLEPFFADNAEEPVMVKNLENVQGEERDIMLFSLTYGPDLTGRVAMNFGPLNQTGGERRLNVAVTRARQGLVVFTSLRPEQIDLNRTSALGVAHLKRFLSFAEHGARAFAIGDGASLGDYESPFEAAVAQRLQARGWVLNPQIGVSGFRVDLGVVDPDLPGSFLAGIECDGATYHRAATARDRDRLRQVVLEGLGWRIFRVWSTDWWTNAAREVERLQALLEAALAEARSARAQKVEEQQQLDPVPMVETVDPAVMAAVEAVEPQKRGTDAGTVAEPGPSEIMADGSLFYEEAYLPRLAELVTREIASQGPIRDDRLAQRIARVHGFQKTGRRILERVLAAVPADCPQTREEVGTFIWPQHTQPPLWNRFRGAAPDQSLDPADLPIEELRVLAASLKDHYHDEEVLLLAMRDACNLGKLRQGTRERFKQAIATT